MSRHNDQESHQGQLIPPRHTYFTSHRQPHRSQFGTLALVAATLYLFQLLERQQSTLIRNNSAGVLKRTGG